MHNSGFYDDFSNIGNTRTLPTPLYRFVCALEMSLRNARKSVYKLFEINESTAINMDFVRTIPGGSYKKMQTPLGVRKFHHGGALLFHLNDEFHAADLPYASRPNVDVTGFTSREELIISERDRDDNVIFRRLIDLRKRKVIAKTVRGDADRWEAWG
jgi:hypothetical protein